VVSGAIMNLTRDGQVAWTDRGIIFTGGLFVWLCIAAIAQWVSANRGRGEWTAMMSILSFIIVVIALAMVVTAPHGAGEQTPATPAVEGKQVEIRYPMQYVASSVCAQAGTVPRGLA
jgi:DNA-binding transcriptional regulator of glucitol operon